MGMTRDRIGSRSKTGILLAAWLGCAGCGLSPAEQPGRVFLKIVSPDHPAIWFVGGDFEKFDQSLHWNEDTQMLSLDIVYTLNGEWPHYEQADRFDAFNLSFPAVRENRVDHELYWLDHAGCKVVLGAVEPGVLGNRVVLRKDVELSAHRKNGILHAMLVVGGPHAP
jgi:hypothetical protein